MSQPNWLTDGDVMKDAYVKSITISLNQNQELAKKLSEFKFQESDSFSRIQPCFVVKAYGSNGNFKQFSMGASGYIDFEGAIYEPIPEFNKWLCMNIDDLNCIFCP